MICVIGCGNPNRCDDGVGPEVVRALRKQEFSGAPKQLRLIDAGTDGMAAMFAARDCTSLIIIDACLSGSEPGAIFEVPGVTLEQAHTPNLNLHDFRWDHALHAGRKIFRQDFPTDVTVLLVEAQSVSFGLELSPPVANAARTVVERVEALIRARLPASETAARASW
jgi:hydrogenase maturation protease